MLKLFEHFLWCLLKFLFQTIDLVLNAPQNTVMETSTAACEDFLYFFINKVNSARAQISAPANDPSVPAPCSAVFNQFESVGLSFVQEIVSKLKPTGSPNDPVAPQLF